MKAVVLLSGGQDSVTSLYWAKHRLGSDVELHALSVAYGQRHATELDAARTVARMAGCASHVLLDIARAMEGSQSALVASSGVELAGDGGMPDQVMPQGLPTSFVPGRNLGLLALAAVRAGAVGAEFIVTGVCQTDYSGYPDCREPFVAAMRSAVFQAWPSGAVTPQILTPLMDRTKAETVLLARNLPGCWDALAHSVTCYQGNACGTCPACVLRAKGFAEAGFADPAASSVTVKVGDSSRTWTEAPDMEAAMRDPAGTLL